MAGAGGGRAKHIHCNIFLEDSLCPSQQRPSQGTTDPNTISCIQATRPYQASHTPPPCHATPPCPELDKPTPSPTTLFLQQNPDLCFSWETYVTPRPHPEAKFHPKGLEGSEGLEAGRAAKGQRWCLLWCKGLLVSKSIGWTESWNVEDLL